MVRVRSILDSDPRSSVPGHRQIGRVYHFSLYPAVPERHRNTTGDDSSSIALPPSTMDASDQAGASLPYWTLGLFSPGSGLARMSRQNPYRRGPSTSDIHCGNLHRRRCIGPDFPLDR